MQQTSYFERDVSWLSFNERILMEAGRENVPLLERINFISIYSSNLDEFYRVRIPALLALHNVHKKIKESGDKAKAYAGVLQQVQETISRQQREFGRILTQEILPLLYREKIHFIYNRILPDLIGESTRNYFFTNLLAFLQPVYLSRQDTSFFPENNKLYLLAVIVEQQREELIIVNIPSDSLPRLYTIDSEDTKFIVFIDDIIKDNLCNIFKNAEIKGCYNFKVTRDAELELADEYEGDIAEKIEKQIAKRDYGLATRFLYESGMPQEYLQVLIKSLGFSKATLVEGGAYHNLKDLSPFPVKNPAFTYSSWPPVPSKIEEKFLLDEIWQRDIMIHTPYQSYDCILRFFNEAAIDPSVEEIYVTLYRIASDSQIVHALINAAKNRKKVFVFIELKARFDEANNIKWARRMKQAGVRIIYSIPALKVHAKIALIKRRLGNQMKYSGLLATGNFNESTAKFYTDHILLTSHKAILREIELLFIFLGHRKQPSSPPEIQFEHLLVARFNLHERFLDLIDREISHAKHGFPAEIFIKLNNLEERVLINKLYEASSAGVQISLIVRSICCLIPNVPHMSENITIKRIVDRYLEHGRVFIFGNKGNKEVYMGSADWMNRNIYRRIEVCFPVYDPGLKNEIIRIFDLEWQDNTKAVTIDKDLNNLISKTSNLPIRSQESIYRMMVYKSKSQYNYL
jgi:polyphosphate kinase